MLRILIFMVFSTHVVAESFVEPTDQDVTEQRASILNTLKEADKVDPMIGLQGEMNHLDIAPLNSGFNDLNLPKRDGLHGLFSAVESVAFSKPQKLTLDSIAPIVLVSQSMPVSLLKDILRQANQFKALVVVRGLPEGEFLDQVYKLQALAEGTGTGLAIDPTLFKRFNVTEVPALVLPLTPLVPCTEQGCSTPDHIKATGDVSIRYFLELITRVGNLAEKNMAAMQLSRVGGVK